MANYAIRVSDALGVLDSTPQTLLALFMGIGDDAARENEGEGTWSPYDVVGHLLHGERTDWIPRVRHIMAGDPRPFDKFDRTAQFAESRGKSPGQVLSDFVAARLDSLEALEEMHLTEADLSRTGLHPELGTVTLGQLLATWVVHDLDHVAQIARVVAKSYTVATGPWAAYLSILRDRTR